MNDMNDKAIEIVRNERILWKDRELLKLAAEATTPLEWFKDGEVEWDWFDQVDESSIVTCGPTQCAISLYGMPMVKNDEGIFEELCSGYRNVEGSGVTTYQGYVLTYHHSTRSWFAHKL